MQGLIIENISNLYKVKCDNKIYICNSRGKFKKEEILPVVGDIVEFSITDDYKCEGIIEDVCDRKIYLKRPKLANLTQLLFVISSKNPKPDLLMLDKQLAFAEFLGIKSVIILNKIDLDDKMQFEQISKVYTNLGYEVIQTNAKGSIGIEKVKKVLKNNINAFSGNSGVGKSTLINAIFESSMTLEGEISKRNKKGKNTTTSIKLYEIDENTYIADTPGFSTFSIDEIEAKDLEKYFVEFKKYVPDCEFVGCTHIKEQNCAIKENVELENINQSRYDRFCKIYLELKEKEERKW